MKKVFLTTIFAAIMIGSSLFYSSCNKEESLSQNSGNEQAEARDLEIQPPNPYPNLNDVVSALTTQGYYSDTIPSWYVSGSSSPYFLCYTNGTDYAFLRVYDSQQDVEEDEWSATCTLEAIAGPEADSCDEPGDDCRMEVVSSPSGFLIKFEIICCG